LRSGAPADALCFGGLVGLFIRNDQRLRHAFAKSWIDRGKPREPIECFAQQRNRVAMLSLSCQARAIRAGKVRRRRRRRDRSLHSVIRIAQQRLGVGEAILFHQGIGAKRKEERLRYLRNYWVKRIGNLPNVRLHTSLDEDQSCGIALVEIVGIDPGQIATYLMNSHKIFTVPIVHDEFRGLRITPNVYTSLNELDRFCDVMETIANKGLPQI
jgi:hypothetical protein